MPTSAQRPAQSASVTELGKLLTSLTAVGPEGRPISREQVRRLKAALAKPLHGAARISRQLGRELQRIEREYRFTSAARAEFQTLLGALGLDSAFPIQIPANSEPCWSHYAHPLKQYRSNPNLPSEADIVIIGAGLTGASAAYHLRDQAAKGLRVIVLDRGSPAGEASGRNAGNFELLPENSVGTYDGLARERLKFLTRCYPTITQEVLRVEAERQASLVFSFAIHNRDLLKQIIEKEQLACDFSPAGWLYLAHTEREEQAICEEVELATRQDQRAEIWSRMKIRQEFGFERGFIGRFVPGDGTYHPAKFVYGVLQIAITAGVELYTGVAVRDINLASDGRHVLNTADGSLLARWVIVATNAFTRQLFPELDAIRPAQSQISLTEFVPDRCRGRAVTCEEGPVYFNQPRAGARDGMAPLLLGGGKDRPMRNLSSRRRSARVHSRLLELRDRYFPEMRHRPFSSEWIGPIALTPDQLPAIGFLKNGIIVAAGFNGYGGSYCVAAGDAAADMAKSGQVPDWLPEDVFSPRRLLNNTPLFFGQTSNLWCYAASLCVRLRTLNRQIRDALEYSRPLRQRSAVLTAGRAPAERDGERQPEISVGTLQALKPFRGFSNEECSELLAMGKVRTARKGDLLLSETGSPASCFAILEGVVDVCAQTIGSERVLARLGPSSIFGQLALIDGGGSEGTCRAQQETLLLELTHNACYELLENDSALAHKFLAVLTGAVIEAARAAERQLQRVKTHKHAKSSGK